jgi:single-strand DNA-binding protein
MFDTQVTVVGNLVADPRLNFTKDGQPVASFRVASTPRRLDRSTGEWRDGDTLYASVTCWRGLAENVAASLKKGQAAIVIGRLSVRPYETKEGEKRQSVDIDALAVGPDLGRVITVVKRAERGVLAPATGGPGTDGAGQSGGIWPTDQPLSAAVADMRATDDLRAADDLPEEDDEAAELVGAGG